MSRRGVSGTLSPRVQRFRLDTAVVDAHMHIMSGFCTPLRAMPVVMLGRRVSRLAGMLGSVLPCRPGALMRFIRLTSHTTAWIASETMVRTAAVARAIPSGGIDTFPMLALPMDMDFAHLDGCHGEPAYHTLQIPFATQVDAAVGELLLGVVSEAGRLTEFLTLLAELTGRDRSADDTSVDADLLAETGAVVSDLGLDNGDIDRDTCAWLVAAHAEALRRASLPGTGAATGAPAHAVVPADERASSERVESARFRFASAALRMNHEYRSGVCCYRRATAAHPERRLLVLAPPGHTSQYETWWEQLDTHVAAAARFPWRIVPLYHYDPRRYAGDPAKPFFWLVHADPGVGGGNVGVEAALQSAFASYRPGAAPFEVRDPGTRSLFLGYKLYPPLGYRPSDFTRVPQLRGFYDACEQLSIPIVVHCNPTGFEIHERFLFYGHDRELSERGQGTPGEESNCGGAGRTFQLYREIAFRTDKDMQARYFSDEYISPEGWVKVLAKYPKLRLSLAHFGANDTPTGRAMQALLEAQFDAHREGAALPEDGPAPEAVTDALVETYREAIERLGRHGGTCAAVPPPPNSGWEFSVTADLKSEYTTHLGLSDAAVGAWMKFPLWNRQIIALICTHEHVYTDISYFFLVDIEFNRALRQHRPACRAIYLEQFGHLLEALAVCAKLRRRVMFGTDWYMVMREVGGVGEYYRDTMGILERLATELDPAMDEREPHLKTMLSVVNPVRFYRLGEVRGAYTGMLRSRFGAREKTLAEADARIADMCTKAEAHDPDLSEDESLSNPCARCERWRDGECQLVRQMGFDSSGAYDYRAAGKT